MDKIRVILISSVRPEPTSGGQIILHRHLVNQPGIKLEVYGEEPRSLHWTTFVRRLVAKLGKIISSKVAGDFWVFWEGRWIDRSLPKNVDRRQPTVVMTVAHGDGFMAAMRFAKKRNLPLISSFQDWWPDMADVHSFAKHRLEREFRRLAEESKAAICVSDGMKKALGARSGVYLPPIPAPRKKPSQSQRKTRRRKKFKLLYCGNLSDYGPMLREALQALEKNDSIELVVRGSKPKWPESFAQEMKKNCLWLEFAPREELEGWLQSADAFLIPMVFEPVMRRRMETSFPSKLIEFSHFGKPLIVWGPEYCSAVAWARRTGAALCVTDPDAKVLATALENLAKSRADRSALAKLAQTAANNELDPVRNQQAFWSILKKIVAV